MCENFPAALLLLPSKLFQVLQQSYKIVTGENLRKPSFLPSSPASVLLWSSSCCGKAIASSFSSFAFTGISYQIYVSLHQLIHVGKMLACKVLANDHLQVFFIQLQPRMIYYSYFSCPYPLALKLFSLLFTIIICIIVTSSCRPEQERALHFSVPRFLSGLSLCYFTERQCMYKLQFPSIAQL